MNLWSSANSLRGSVSAKTKTLSNEHALMTEADTDRSLQLVLDQGHGTSIWRAARRPARAFRRPQPSVQSIACRQSFLHSSTSMHSMLCYRRWKCVRRSSTTVTTSSEPSLSCGSNAGMLQRNHRRLHWMHTRHAMHPCIQTYPSRCRCSSLYPSPPQW